MNSLRTGNSRLDDVAEVLLRVLSRSGWQPQSTSEHWDTHASHPSPKSQGPASETSKRPSARTRKRAA
jgi:hypothetical protein